MSELIRHRFEHQLALALVIHVVQLTDTKAQKVGGFVPRLDKETQSTQGEEFLDINLEA
ncbi:hypothetical protein [Macromonas bipunctata]|uniref:hypothetical protein n=1 Tax=Macromonas bipunctata TaxID=183670 RepID=UPI001473CCCC|nr:hypothetical protein [Macromonas bipunctata]